MPSVLLWRFYIFLHITFVLCISAPLNFPWMHKILRYSIIIRIYVNGNLFSVFILICCVITCIYVYILYILYMCIYIYMIICIYVYIHMHARFYFCTSAPSLPIVQKSFYHKGLYKNFRETTCGATISSIELNHTFLNRTFLPLSRVKFDLKLEEDNFLYLIFLNKINYI